MAVRDIDRIAQRVREAREARLRDLLGDATPAPADPLGLSFAPGDRVFDTISGEEGKVHSATRRQINRQPTQRDNG